MAAKTLKNFVSLIDSKVQTSQEGEETQNKQRKTESYVFNGFGNGISHSRELDEFLQAEFGCVPERFLLSVRTDSKPENLYIEN